MISPAALIDALFLGVVEGVTEFLPVSSTGHLILFTDILKLQTPPGKVFEIVIQLGAILAVCWIFREKLLFMARRPTEPHARTLIRNLFLAWLPAVVIGAFAHDFIKSVLFSPLVVSFNLVLGGLLILAIERLKPAVRQLDMAAFSPKLSLAIGFCQALAMIPGISRSGATILGAMLLGVDRKAAAEFSFFLAIPTMFAATAYDLYKNHALLSTESMEMIVVGFVAAFFSALVVVRAFIAFVTRHNFTPFAWYRIAVGALMLYLLV